MKRKTHNYFSTNLCPTMKTSIQSALYYCDNNVHGKHLMIFTGGLMSAVQTVIEPSTRSVERARDGLFTMPTPALKKGLPQRYLFTAFV